MSEPIDDGGPAFPGNTKDAAGGRVDYPGMSLRDWLAGLAMQSILTAACQGHLSRIGGGDDLGPADFAKAAYANADAVIATGKDPS